MEDASHHGSMAEVSVARTIHHGNTVLIHHGDGVLIDLAGSTVRARGLGGRRSARQIVHFRTADLIPCEVVTR